MQSNQNSLEAAVPVPGVVLECRKGKGMRIIIF